LLLPDSDPMDGQRLGSPPTLSRFENPVTSKDPFAMAGAGVRNLSRPRIHGEQDQRRVWVRLQL
jgi:hypothetical protein